MKYVIFFNSHITRLLTKSVRPNGQSVNRIFIASSAVALIMPSAADIHTNSFNFKSTTSIMFSIVGLTTTFDGTPLSKPSLVGLATKFNGGLRSKSWIVILATTFDDGLRSKSSTICLATTFDGGLLSNSLIVVYR